MKMPISGDTRQALRLLEHIQGQLKRCDVAPPVNPAVTDDLNALISVLDSPVFNSILNIQDSLQELKKQIHKHPSILPVDFDISPSTGELVLSVPSDPTPLQNSDSYEHSSEEPNYAYDSPPKSTRHVTRHDSDAKMQTPSVAPPDYSFSAITNDSYAEEFQRTIDQGAQGRDIHNLQLFKPDGSSLGFSVVGLRSEQKGELGIFIQEIQPNGIAGRDGRLQEGDQILAIDGQPLDSNISHQQAIGILQQARGLVELVVARGGIDTLPPGQDDDHHSTSATFQGTAGVSLERSPSAASSSKGSDMVLNTEWAQVEAIDLVNDGSGLGFGIIGGRSTGVVVKTILPGGVADKDGRLQSGDHILQIGEVNLRGMGSEQVAMVLRQSGSHVRLIVARPVDPAAPVHAPTAPLVPTRILSDPEEVEKHLAMFQPNGFPEPEPYKGPADVDSNFVYQRELNDPEEYYDAPYSPSDAGRKEGGGRTPAGDYVPVAGEGEEEELPEMETFEVGLVKDQQGLGITIAGYVCEKEEISGIFVKSIAKGSAADNCSQIRVNDQIIEVDGRPLHGYTNHQAVEVLRNTGKMVKLRLARYLRGAKFQQLQLAIASGELSYPGASPNLHDGKGSSGGIDVTDIGIFMDNDYAGPLDPLVEATIRGKWSKVMGPEYDIIVAQLSKFREGGGLGISLEGTVDVEDGKEVRPHHYIRSILGDGPVGVNNKLRSGDELLEVNGERLFGMNHHGVVGTLKELPMHVRMVCARRKSAEREYHQSVSGGNSHPVTDYPDLSAAPDFKSRGSLLAHFGGSLTSLTPVSERLVKAKSDGSLAVGTSASSSTPPMDTALSKLKSRSLEPLTGLAMWSNEPQIIELIKGDRGLGFSILDYQDPMNPNETVIVIRSLVPGGVAQQDGRLIPGDRLLFVNDINLENASLDAAVQALKGATKGVVRIGVAKPLPLPESGQSSQVVLDGNSHLGDLNQKTLEFLPRLPSFTMDFDQFYVMSKRTGLNPDLDYTVPETTEEVDTKFSHIMAPSVEPIWKYNVAALPIALERTIRIPKRGELSLGFKVDVLEAVGGVVVSSIAEGSAAEKDGRVAAGDFLTSINSSPLLDLNDSQVNQILQQAGKLNTDVVVKFIPAVDAAVYHQSALISLEKEADDISAAELKTAVSKDQDDEDEFFDVSEMEPPDDPPPPPPVHPPPLDDDLPLARDVPLIVPLPRLSLRTSEEPSRPDHTPKISPLPVVGVLKTNPYDCNLLTKTTPKPAVPLKPIRKSLLIPLSASSKEKSRTSTIEGLIHDMNLSSLSRQWGPERSVQLWRDKVKGLGISIISGKADTLQAGIFIKNVLPDSPAGWNGTLKRGDKILEVSGVDIRNASHAKAVEVFKNAENPVKFVVQSLVPVPKKTDVEKPWSSNKLSPTLLSVSSVDQCPPAPANTPSTFDPATSPGANVVVQSSPPKVSPRAVFLSETITESKIEAVHKEPPLPPPRTVSSRGIARTSSTKSTEAEPQILVSSIERTPSTESSKNELFRNQNTCAIPRTPSTKSSSGNEDFEALDNLCDDLPRKGKVLTKKGVRIDSLSAGNIKLSSSDCDEEDIFGYTDEKIQKKYGDMKGDLIVVDIVKGSNKLGLSLVGNKDRNKMSVFVCGMHPKGVAAKDGRIKIGDELLEVNGVVVHGRCHLNASAMIKGLSGTAYKILLLRREGSIDEMAVKPLSQFPSELDEEAAEDKYCHYRGMRTVTVRKGAQGLGIMIIEGKHAEVGQGIFISDIQEQSAAEQAGLSVGDMILSANETDLVGSDYDTAASILKQAEGLITLIVANPNKPTTGYIYEDEKKNDEVIKVHEKNMNFAGWKKEKSPPPLVPPKPVHLIAKSPNTQSEIAVSSISCDISTQNTTSTTNNDSVLSPVTNSENVSFEVCEPKTCEIKSGYETTIEIVKEKIGLGLSIVGGTDTPLGAIIIHEVYPDGAAALDGRLRPGDMILEVNGECLRESTHEHGITTLRQTPAVVSMLVYREDSHNQDEDFLEIIEVELNKKAGRGLGLSIVGRKNGPGVYISEVVKGGIAEADGRLIQGDQILEVNSQDLKTATQEHAAAVLKTTMGRINMKIGRLKAGSRKNTACLASTPKIQETLDNPPESKTIVLERGPDGLGFSIVGGSGSQHGDLPIYVKKVFDKGAAFEDGRLQRGDRILSVNEQSLEGLTHEEAVAILKKVTGTITLTVSS